MILQKPITVILDLYAHGTSVRLWRGSLAEQVEAGRKSAGGAGGDGACGRPRRRVVEGKSGLVVATMSPIAVNAGMEALRQGGTAADAAATVALTQITTALGSYVSYAGILQLVYYDAKSGKVSTMNAGWNSYLGETDPKSIPVDDLGPLAFGTKPTEGAEGRKTLVPGFMAGIEQMHKRFGRLPVP